jgi:hypothetical protein
MVTRKQMGVEMNYSEYSYLWPPRPKNAVTKTALPIYNKLSWVAQIKKNGTANVLAVSPEKKLVCMTRHNEPHKMWAPTEASSQAFTALPGSGWYVFVAELLHSKTSHIKDTNYVNDILVNNGEYLVGTKFGDRQKLLEKLFNVSELEQTYSHWIVNQNTWIARSYDKDFKSLFESLDKPEDEGLVMKNPEAPLKLCTLQTSNYSWLAKIRRPTKNYGF